MSRASVPETEPAIAEHEGQDYDSMSEDQLKELIDNPSEQRETEVEAGPEPEPEPQETEPETEPEPVEAETQPQETEQEQEEPDRLSALEKGLEEERLRREAQEARNQHLNFLLSRANGEIGHLRQQQPRQQPRTRDEFDDPSDSGESRYSAPDPELQRLRHDLDEVRSEKTTQALLTEFHNAQNENRKFWESVEATPDAEAFQQSWNENFQKELEGLGAKDAVQSGDTKLATSILRAAYKSALAETRLTWLGKRMEQNRTSPQSSQSRQRKLEAASSAQSARPAVRPKAKRLEDMTPDEIKAEIDRRDALGIDVR